MTDLRWLDELIFLKLGLDLTRKDAQYPIVPSGDLDKFRAAIAAKLEQVELGAMIDENIKLIKQCHYVAKVLRGTLQKEKVTLESIIAYADANIAELKAQLTKDKLNKLRNNL